MKLENLRIERRDNPLGLDVARPRFSWKIISDEQDVMQAAYQIAVSNSKEIVWNSGRRESDISVFIEYEGSDLEPCTPYKVDIIVWDNKGNKASIGGNFETGLLKGENFKAEWITHTLPDAETASPIFFKDFSIAKPLKSARIYATALGIYEIRMNGEKVGDAFFAPGWTNYKKRLQYQTYAVSNLPEGRNKIEITVGNGWYKGHLGFMPMPNQYGDRVSALTELHLLYEDGSTEIIGTDTTWKVTTGPIQSSEFYYGEVFDSLAAPISSVFAVPGDYGKERIIAQEDEPVRISQRLPAQNFFITPKGEKILDFGQNIAGFVEMKITGTKGQKIKLRHAEALDENGDFYTGNLSFATSEDTFICDGTPQIFMPHFTFHGFRYVCVEGLDDVNYENFSACALTSDLDVTGKFECSHKLINQLQSNIQWSQQDNFIDIPTDCPQRSERLGWTGDVRAFCSTAMYNSDTYLFFVKWLRDLASEQTTELGVTQVVPNLLSQPGTAFWGDVATVLPWRLYNTYGDKHILTEQYESMKGWVDYITAHSGPNGLWQDGYQYGDWLALDAELQGLTDERNGATDRYYIANVCYADSANILAKAAGILGKSEDEKTYSELYQHILSAFREEYVTKSGRLVSETQTACVLALYFNLLEEKDRAPVLQILKDNIGAHKNHITTGFVGTPFICHTLSENGAHKLAAKILLNEECPSWLYEVKMGATTIWERWDSILPDKRFNPKNMNSLNHYAYGSIGDWLYRKLAGINEMEPGYKKFEIRPQFIKGITEVKASFDSVYGLIRSEWTCKNGQITVEVQIPVNTTADIYLPEKGERMQMGSGVYHFEYATDTKLEIDRYSMETTLNVVLNHPVAKEIIKQYAPEMLTNPMIEYVKDSQLNQILAYSAEAKPLYEMIIKAMNESEPS